MWLTNDTILLDEYLDQTSFMQCNYYNTHYFEMRVKMIKHESLNHIQIKRIIFTWEFFKSITELLCPIYLHRIQRKKMPKLLISCIIIDFNPFTVRVFWTSRTSGSQSYFHTFEKSCQTLTAGESRQLSKCLSAFYVHRHLLAILH